MYDLQRLNGSFKGIIGECMFKLTNKKVVINKFFNKQKYFDIFGKYFNQEQIEFLKENWNSIDGIEIKFVNGKKKILLYEIKTKNAFYSKRKKWLVQLTTNTYKIYKNSLKFGFEPKIVTILFHKNWEYDVKIKDFEYARFSVDKPTKYEKK